MKTFFTLSLLLLSALGFAQDGAVFSPQSIIVNPVPSFEVETFVNKDSSGQRIPSYEVGDSIRIGVRTSEDAYVYLFSIKSDGQIQQILPNELDSYGQDNFVRAGQTKYFPPQDARYSFEVSGPTGLDKVLAVASIEPLDTSDLAQFSSGADFATSRTSEDDFADTLSIIVRPLPQNDWVTDTALFYIGGQPVRQRYGTLNITSSPDGARAYVDGQFVGYTPLRYGTTSGSHEVRVESSDYDEFQTSVTLNGGETLDVDASLGRAQRTGSVSFTSQPSGADVYVDGQFVGTTPTGSVTLNPGDYQASFRTSGFESATVNFSVDRGSVQEVSTSLRADNGSLRIRANVGGATVFIDGEEYGTIPNGSGQLSVSDLPAGTHQLTVTAPGFTTAVREFDINPGRTTEIRVSQSRR